MPPDPPKPQQPSNVDELVAAREYAQAADLLRAELQSRGSATLAERLRLADLLVLAERGKDALPILLAVGDELARYGLGDRALEALRRADAIEPGHAAVRERLESLARTARARVAAAQATGRQLDAKTDPASEQPAEIDFELLRFVQELATARGGDREELATALFAGVQHYLFRRVQAGLHPRRHAAGGIVLSEGDPGDSVFLLVNGSVRILVVGGHGRAFEIRKLDAPDFFGEVSALSGQPRSASVVAVSDCDLLEVDRWALERLLEARPLARRLLEGTSAGRSHSEEESVVRALPDTLSTEQADAVLSAHFGGRAWSPKVRLHFAKQMLDAGLANDAYKVIASVADELARNGQAEMAIGILKRVEQARRQSGERAKPVAASEASFRTWLGSVSKRTEALAGGAAPAQEEEAQDESGR